MLRRLLYLVCFLLLFPMAVRADLPLTIQDLLMPRNRYQFEFGLTYANSERSGVDSQVGLIQTGEDSFTLLPVEVGEERSNADVLAMTLGLRYGLTGKTEIYTRLTGIASYERIQDTEGTSNRNSRQVSDLVLGINHQFSADNGTPALLGFAEVAVAENMALDGTDLVYGKTGQIGFMAYHGIDPLVLSLTAGYRYARTRDIDNLSVAPGDLFFISPGIHFAVNDKVTLTGGIQWILTDKHKVEGESIDTLNTQTGLEFGLAYALSERTTLNVTTLVDVTGDSGAQIGFDLLYEFGG